MRVLTRWDGEFSTGETNEILQTVALTLSKRIQNERMREVIVSLLGTSDFRALCDLDFNYADLSVADALTIRQILALYSKRADLDFGVDRRAVSFCTFKEAERLCSETNQIFRMHGRGGFLFPPRVESVLFMAQRKISRILGEVPTLEQLPFRFGPGATTNVRKADACSRLKLSRRLQCSEDLLPVVSSLLEEMPAWIPFTEESETAMVDVEIRPSKLCFVPKTAKTDRAIATEPVLNTMYQAGIGQYMAERLRLNGIDIKDQSKNQRLAREGSLTGALATLDLSNASDTLATEFVYHMLPIDWFLLLDHGRTTFIDTPEGILLQQKFSSMGNGFTFPLETLLFYSLAWASVEALCEGHEEKTVSVYGDDIIIPTYAYDLLSTVLHCVGCVVNHKKSFKDGPFRESCGADYLSGINIRPFYLKNELTCSDLFVMHNAFYRHGDNEVCEILVQYVHEPLRIYGPDGYGDGHLLGEWIPKPHKRRAGWAGYTFSTFTFRTRKKYRALPGDYVYPAYSVYVSSCSPKRSSGFSLYSQTGELGDILPGVNGYKRIEIYTLEC